MTTAPVIELRSIKHIASMSEETHCYTATLYVDGDKWGEVSNRGHGGCDDFRGFNGRKWDDIKALDARIAATMPKVEACGMELTPDLEIICGEAVNAWLRERDFTNAMKRKVLFTKPNTPGVYQISVRKGETLGQVIPLYRKAHPDWTFLADLPVEQAKAVYFSN